MLPAANGDTINHRWQNGLYTTSGSERFSKEPGQNGMMIADRKDQLIQQYPDSSSGPVQPEFFNERSQPSAGVGVFHEFVE